MGRSQDRIVSVFPVVNHDFLFTSRYSGAIRDAGSPGEFQMILSGSEIDFAALKANPDIATLQSEFNRATGRSDLVIKEVTNWQGEWR